MALNEKLIKKIRGLWANSNFPGCFSGLLRFQQCLALFANIHVGLKDLREIMRGVRSFVYQVQRRNRFPRNKYINSSGTGENLQADLMFMPDFEGYKYVLVIVDLFSLFITVFCLKNKKSKSIEDCFAKYIKDHGKFQQLTTDQGIEFGMSG